MGRKTIQRKSKPKAVDVKEREPKDSAGESAKEGNRTRKLGYFWTLWVVLQRLSVPCDS